MVNATDGLKLHLLCANCYFKLGEEHEGGVKLVYKKFECRFSAVGGAAVQCPRCGEWTTFKLTSGGSVAIIT